MKHVTYGEKSLIVGDEAADLMMSYAAALGQNATADTVDLNAISSDGDQVVATFLLNEGSSVMVESTNSTWPEPNNDESIAYMKDRMKLLVSPPFAQTEPSNGQDLSTDEPFFNFDQTYDK